RRVRSGHWCAPSPDTQRNRPAVFSSLCERTPRAVEPGRAQLPLRARVGRLPDLDASTALRREKPLLLERGHAEAPAQALWWRRWDREAEAVLEHGAGLELQRQWRTWAGGPGRPSRCRTGDMAQYHGTIPGVLEARRSDRALGLSSA